MRGLLLTIIIAVLACALAVRIERAMVTVAGRMR